MINLIIVFAYMAIGIDAGIKTYKDSTIEDRHDVAYMIGVILALLLWPIAYMLHVIYTNKKLNSK